VTKGKKESALLPGLLVQEEEDGWKQKHKHLKMAKTYNSGYSLVVTHLTTNPPVRCLNRAERTGSLVFNVLWSYVEEPENIIQYIAAY
jgi:hypothetical protein